MIALRISQVVIIALILLGAALVLISATTYNNSRASLCEDNGLVFGSEYGGRYGCVELHPFEEFEK